MKTLTAKVARCQDIFPCLACNTVSPRKEEPTFSRVRLFLVLIEKVHMEISESKAFHRFLFKRSVPKLVGEQNLLSKIFILVRALDSNRPALLKLDKF